MTAYEALTALPALIVAGPWAARASAGAARAVVRSGGRAGRLAGRAARRAGARGAVAGTAALVSAGAPASTALAMPAPVGTGSPTTAAGRSYAAPVPAAPRADEVHVVQPGECLWSIAAARLGPGADDADIAAEWPRWYRANRALIGRDPGLIGVGMRLRVPHPAPSTTRSTSSARRTGTSATHDDHADPTGQHRWSADSLDPDRR